MIRVIKWCIGVCLILALALPGVVGLLTAKYLPDALAQMDRASDWHLDLAYYNRGWFGSMASVDLTPPDSSEPIQFNAIVRHGPLSRFGVGWLSGFGTVREGFRLDWTLGLTLNLEAHLDLSSWPQGDGTLDLDLSERFRRVDYELSGVSIRQGMLLDNAAGSGWWVNDQGVWTGTTTLTANRLATAVADLARPSLQLDLTHQDDLATLELRSGSEQLRLDQDYRDWQGTLTLGRLHRPTVASIISALNQSLKSGLPPDQLASALRNQVVFSLPLLLQHQPLIEVSALQLNTEAGDAIGEGRLEFIAPPPPGYLADPGLLAQVINASWKWQAPRSLLQTWLGPDTLARLLDQGVATGDSQLSSEALFKDQVLLLNGTAAEVNWARP